MTLVPPSSKYGNAPVVLGALATGWPHTGDTTEVVLASVAVPANAMGLNGRLEIVTEFSYPNNANNKILRVKFGATAVVGTTTFSQYTNTTTVTFRAFNTIANVGAANSQKGAGGSSAGGFGASGSAMSTSAIDTTAQAFVVFTGQLASAADSITLEAYSVTLYPGV